MVVAVITGTLHVADDAGIRARIVHHEEHTVDGYTYPARTTAHVDLDGIGLTMTPAQAERLRDALTAALDEARL